MNALIVDDDRFMVAALKKKIDWVSLRIDEVYEALNIRQARKILQSHPVQIMLCDIEMPQGSGLELLGWIREQGLSVQTIFLTNYADFNYAQKALELQSLDYYLKPVAFEKLYPVIQKAVRKAEEEMRRSIAGEAQLRDLFFTRLVDGYLEDGAAIREAADGMQLSYSPEDVLLPVLVAALSDPLSSVPPDVSHLYEPLAAYSLPDSRFVCALPLSGSNAWLYLAARGENASPVCPDQLLPLIEELRAYTGCDISICLGEPCRLDALRAMIVRMTSMLNNRADRRNHVLSLGDQTPGDQPYTPPDIARMRGALMRMDAEAFQYMAESHLDALCAGGALNIEALRLFRVDIMQLVYSVLEDHNIEARRLFAGAESDRFFTNALNSTEDMRAYVGYVAWLVTNGVRLHECPTTVVDAVKEYIRSHLDEELTRVSLARIVYLHPDYLARLFKREEGVSLGGYIKDCRMEVACELLRDTRLPIGGIAERVGYGNYSYFIKVFKERYGMTPAEYRRG